MFVREDVDYRVRHSPRMIKLIIDSFVIDVFHNSAITDIASFQLQCVLHQPIPLCKQDINWSINDANLVKNISLLLYTLMIETPLDFAVEALARIADRNQIKALIPFAVIPMEHMPRDVINSSPKTGHVGGLIREPRWPSEAVVLIKFMLPSPFIILAAYKKNPCVFAYPIDSLRPINYSTIF